MLNYDHLETETDTRVRHITPALKAAGWPSASIWMEYSLRSDRFRIVPEKNITQKVMLMYGKEASNRKQ